MSGVGVVVKISMQRKALNASGHDDQSRSIQSQSAMAIPPFAKISLQNPLLIMELSIRAKFTIPVLFD